MHSLVCSATASSAPPTTVAWVFAATAPSSWRLVAAACGTAIEARGAGALHHHWTPSSSALPLSQTLGSTKLKIRKVANYLFVYNLVLATCIIFRIYNDISQFSVNILTKIFTKTSSTSRSGSRSQRLPPIARVRYCRQLYPGRSTVMY